MDSYIGFHHELNKFDQLLTPDEKELERRKRIQQSRNKRNQNRQDEIKKLINEINNSCLLYTSPSPRDRR